MSLVASPAIVSSLRFHSLNSHGDSVPVKPTLMLPLGLSASVYSAPSVLPVNPLHLASSLVFGMLVLGLLFYHLRRVKTFKAQLKHLKAQLEIKTESLRRLSRTDALTNLHNRLYLEEHLAEELARFERYRSYFCVLLVRVDDLPSDNNTFSQARADEILKQIALLLRSGVRRNDMLGRWRSGDFFIICPQTKINGALTLAESLRVKIEIDPDCLQNKTTCCVGVAEVQADETDLKLIERVEQAVYQARKAGLNKVARAQEVEVVKLDDCI